MNFGDSSATGDEVDEWVETHAGRPANLDSAANAGMIDDIPDLDGDGGDEAEGISSGIKGMSVSDAKGGDTPDLDDIPDMEEDLEEDEDEATAAPKRTAPTSNVIDAR